MEPQTDAKLVYVAGPLFSQADRSFLSEIVDTLAVSSGLDPMRDFFLPHRDGHEEAARNDPKLVFGTDIAHLEQAHIVVGLLDGQDVDSGTAVELGYAYCKGKKIFGLLTDSRAEPPFAAPSQRPNIMVVGICESGRTLHRELGILSADFARYVSGNPPLQQRRLDISADG